MVFDGVMREVRVDESVVGDILAAADRSVAVVDGSVDGLAAEAFGFFPLVLFWKHDIICYVACMVVQRVIFGFSFFDLRRSISRKHAVIAVATASKPRTMGGDFRFGFEMVVELGLCSWKYMVVVGGGGVVL